MSTKKGRIDRRERILYLVSMVQTRKGRGVSLLVAGLISGAVLLHAGAGQAGSGLPIPQKKPSMSSRDDSGIPLPQLKPSTENESIAAYVPTGGMPPLPGHKPSLVSQPKYKGPLSNRQAEQYKEIFALQDKGQMAAAKAKIADLDNGLLLGHVLAQRYLHPTAYRASFNELNNWMDNYSDHPHADKIYRLTLARKPKGFSGHIQQPASFKKLYGNLGSVSSKGRTYKTSVSRTRAQDRDVRRLLTTIRKHVDRYEPTQAWKLLNANVAAEHIDNVEFDYIRAIVAAGYLYAGKYDEAARHAAAAQRRSGRYVPQAAWVNGLVNWHRGHFRTAASAFESAATSDYSSGWMVSAAAYWASRAHMRAGNVREVSRWLKVSAGYSRTFYGLIATRSLGHNYSFNWDIPGLKGSHIDIIESREAGKRAHALVGLGRLDMAETELKKEAALQNDEGRQAYLAYAYHNRLPSLALQLGHAIPNPQGGLYDAALYPLMPWEPKSGYRVDQSLIHALIRQESRFNTDAESGSGATGLMQLMPATARFVAGPGIGPESLRDPRTNLDIGQKYVETLLNDSNVGQDLFSLTIAYNAGPGNLSRWKKERPGINDPLMFIETIPFAETRAFVERVLSNYWMYRLQMGQQTPSLDAVAEGKWARYVSQDKGAVKFAER